MSLSRQSRILVRRRAQDACEYCRLPATASILPHQVDHIIARQHRGSDEVSNLCLSCIRCNLRKGPNIASVDPKELGRKVGLFHPRLHVWDDHFYSRTMAGLWARRLRAVQPPIFWTSTRMSESNSDRFS